MLDINNILNINLLETLYAYIEILLILGMHLDLNIIMSDVNK